MPVFDADYYDRYYFSAATRIAEPEYFDRLAQFVAAYLNLLGCPPETILDAGCGAGMIHAGLLQAWPEVRITAFDTSEYVCDRYGWTHSSMEDFESSDTYDLVICYDVLQYLDRGAASAAIEKLSDLSSAVLLFGVLTKEDWQQNCDQERTDGRAHLRSAAWYRERLKDQFRNIGGGIFVRRDVDVVTYALESL